LPIQCAIGVFWDAPSKVTPLSVKYLKWWPKSHHELTIAFGADSSFILFSELNHASFTIGTSLFAANVPSVER
jgi:hypothetical protein